MPIIFFMSPSTNRGRGWGGGELGFGVLKWFAHVLHKCNVWIQNVRQPKYALWHVPSIHILYIRKYLILRLHQVWWLMPITLALQSWGRVISMNPRSAWATLHSVIPSQRQDRKHRLLSLYLAYAPLTWVSLVSFSNSPLSWLASASFSFSLVSSSAS